jgi:hypothetical protein
MGARLATSRLYGFEELRGYYYWIIVQGRDLNQYRHHQDVGSLKSVSLTS